MKIIFAALAWLLEGSVILTSLVVVVCGGLYAVTVVLTTVAGVLFGFSNQSPICNAYFSKTTTVGEMLTTPIIPYACKSDAGLLTLPVRKVRENLDKPWYKK